MKSVTVLVAIVGAAFVGAVLAQSPGRSKDQDANAATGRTADREETQTESKKPGEYEAQARDHLWLKQLAGEWDAQWKMYMQPDQPPAEAAGTDSVRAIGEHWVVAETKTTMMGESYNGVLSLGYDAQKKQFNGTWMDSFGGHLWVYKGTLNDAGDTLTLETEGPSLHDPDKTAQYKEAIHITGKDTRTFTSSIQADDGTWKKILSVDYRRRVSDARLDPRRSERGAQGTINVHYLEIVTPEMDATCQALEKAHGVTFGDRAAELGNARTARLEHGGRLGVRGPMRETEEPVVRPYVLVDDIGASLKAAVKVGGQVAMSPTEIPGHGTFAIYVLGGIDHGLWQLESRRP